MENKGEDFRKNLRKVEIQGSEGEHFEIVIDKVLNSYYEFYIPKNKEVEYTKERENIEENERYLKSIEEILRVLPKNKVIDMVCEDYKNKKISAKLAKKVLDVINKPDLNKEKSEVRVETRVLTDEESEKMFELMKGKHPITRIVENEDNEENEK